MSEITTTEISVIICAYTEERWTPLSEAIASVQHQSLAPMEIIVVIDHNPALLERCREAFPNVRVIENALPRGLSDARNSGIHVSNGTLLAFLDDDAIADEDWLRQLCASLDDPHVMGAGGSIISLWDNRKPAWFPEEFYWVVGCTHRGTPTGEVRNLVGANMLIRRSVFDTVGGFRSEIGRVGTLPLGCEETELCIRVHQKLPDSKFLHVPDVQVKHHVPAKRARWSYFQSRCYSEGISKAAVSRLVGRQASLSAETAYTLQTLPQGVLRGVVDTFAHGDLSGLRRSAAIIAGLTMTTWGYLRAMVANRFTQHKPTGDRGPLNILMVSARFSPFVGGTETHTYEVARRLSAQGNKVTVLTTDPSGKLPTMEQRDNFTVQRVQAYPANRDYYFAPRIFSIIVRGNWDVIHIQGYHTLVAPLAMLAAWIARKPFILTFHSGGHSSATRNALRSFQRAVLRPLVVHATQLVGVSAFEADFFSQSLHIPRERFSVISNGSSLPKVSGVTSSDAPETLIVSLGRLERYKGHQRAIAALPKILAQRPDVKLRIVGNGPYEQELRELSVELGVADRVEIGGLPSDDREGMAALLMQAALVVALSDYEGNPVAVLEAISLQRSILVTDTSGLGELARQGYAAAIPLNSTPDQIAAAVIRQLDRPLVPAKIALPTWDDCAGQLLNIYRHIKATV